MGRLRGRHRPETPNVQCHQGYRRDVWRSREEAIGYASQVGSHICSAVHTLTISIVTAKEALAISTLGVDHITISGTVLQALADDRNVADFRGEGLDVNVKQSQANVAGQGKPTSFLSGLRIEADPSRHPCGRYASQ